MSFIAKLMLDEEEMNVLHCSYRFTQGTNTIGRPSSIPRGGSVNLILESTGSTDLFDWMISPTQTKSGRITFYRRDNMIKLKTLEFIDAHCVDYDETFDHQNSNPMQVQLTISAHKIRLNDSEYVNNWPE
jgi:hypothetical protein